MESRETEEENNKVHELRQIVVQHDHSSEYIDDATLRRFLLAQDLNVEKASQFFLRYLKWRKNFVPLGYIPDIELHKELEKKKIFIQGLDKVGRPIGVILAVKHERYQRDLEEFKRLVVYGFDRICSCMGGKTDKFVIIVNLQGWGYKNMDLQGYLAALEILQEYYPERLGKVYMVHVPYLFFSAWKIGYPFINQATKEKVVFVEDKKLMETLLRDIDQSQLPQIFGGKLPLIPAQDCSAWSPNT